MGEYATEYINNVLEEASSMLSDKLSNRDDTTLMYDERLEILKNKIGVIGNEVIRTRLEKMMDLFGDGR